MNKTQRVAEHYDVIVVGVGAMGSAACFGFFGHGFKFAPVVGEALAELALDGRNRLSLAFLSLKRLRKTGEG